jgi:hypothetical protein
MACRCEWCMVRRRIGQLEGLPADAVGAEVAALYLRLYALGGPSKACRRRKRGRL